MPNASPHSGSDHLPKQVKTDAPDGAAYWARVFQTPVERVRDAVAAVGDDPARVAAHLGKPWPNAQSGIV